MSLIVQKNLAMLAAGQPDDHVESGGLAGAVRPQQPDDFAAFDLQGQIPQHLP